MMESHIQYVQKRKGWFWCYRIGHLYWAAACDHIQHDAAVTKTVHNNKTL